MPDGFELDLTLFLPTQELPRETVCFSVWSQTQRAGIELSLLPTLHARLSAHLDGGVHVEIVTSDPLPQNRVFVLALVIAGGATSTKARIHVDDVVAAKIRTERPVGTLLDLLDGYVVRLNRGRDEAPGVRMGLVEFVVASAELPAIERLTALAYYRANARNVGHLTWFEPDGHGFQLAGAQSLKLSPGVRTVPIPATAGLPRGPAGMWHRYL